MKLLILDGNSVINRAFFGVKPLTNREGLYTHAIFGFLNILEKVEKEEQPEAVCVAFDLHGPTFRHLRYDGYKATRHGMPEELAQQMPVMKQVLKAMNIPIYECQGWEADDIIGTVGKICGNNDWECVIVTGDRDSLQLIDKNVHVKLVISRMGQTSSTLYNEETFRAEYGFEPKKLIDLKALMGDNSDNIPGVPGVGEKTALNLIQTYKSIDGLYERIDEIKGKLQEKLILNKDLAYLSKTLATICLDCGVDTDTEKMRVPTTFSGAVKKRFIDLEFKSLSRRDDLFKEDDFTTSDSESTKPSSVIIVESLDSSFDIFSKPIIGLVLGENQVSLSDGDVEYSFPIMRSLMDDGFSETEVLRFLSPIFTGNKTLIAYDKKSLRHYLKRNLNIDLTCPAHDVSIMKYLADFSGASLGVKDVFESYNLDEKTPAFSLIKGYEKLRQTVLTELPGGIVQNCNLLKSKKEDLRSKSTILFHYSLLPLT